MKNIEHRFIGKRFEKLKVIARDTTRKGRPHWVCKCRCGGFTSVRSDALTDGLTKSCGCLVYGTMKNRAHA